MFRGAFYRTRPAHLLKGALGLFFVVTLLGATAHSKDPASVTFREIEERPGCK